MYEDPEIQRIIHYQAAKAYYINQYLIGGFCDIEDLEQIIFEKLWRDDLLNSEEYGLISVIAKRACIDYCRTTIYNYRKKEKQIAIEYLEDLEAKRGNFYYDKYYDKDKVDNLIALEQLKEKTEIDDRSEYILNQLMEGETQKEIGISLRLTESRICQLRKGIIKDFNNFIDYGKRGKKEKRKKRNIKMENIEIDKKDKDIIITQDMKVLQSILKTVMDTKGNNGGGVSIINVGQIQFTSKNENPKELSSTLSIPKDTEIVFDQPDLQKENQELKDKILLLEEKLNHQEEEKEDITIDNTEVNINSIPLMKVFEYLFEEVIPSDANKMDYLEYLVIAFALNKFKIMKASDYLGRSYPWIKSRNEGREVNEEYLNILKDKF